MVDIDDVMGGKLIVQMGLAGKSQVRSMLEQMQQAEDSSGLVTELLAAKVLDRDAAQRVQLYVKLYQHVRHESLYLKLIEKKKLVPTEVVRSVVALVESEWYKRRIGSVLVGAGRLSKADDSSFQSKVNKQIGQQNQKILSRYLAENFKGVENPLVPAKRISKKTFRVSSIFRGRTTRSFVRSRLKKDSSAIADLERSLSLNPTVEESGFNEDWALPEDFVIDFGDEPPTSASDSAINVRALTETTALTSVIVTRHQFISAFGEQSFQSNSGTDRLIGGFLIKSGPFYRGIGEAFYRVDSDGSPGIMQSLDPRVATASDVDQFEHQLTIAQRLEQQPGILTPVGQGRAGPMRYMVLPEVFGYSLRSRLEFGGYLSVPEWFDTVHAVLANLVAAAKQGIVFRALNTETVVFEENRRQFCFIDLSSCVDVSTAGSEVPALPDYFKHYVPKPDQATTPLRSGLFCLGVLSFELLTAVKPNVLDGTTSAAAPTQFLKLQDLRPDATVAPQLQQWIDRLLGCHATESPFASFEQAAESLSALGAGPKSNRRDSREIVDEIFGDLLS